MEAVEEEEVAAVVELGDLLLHRPQTQVPLVDMEEAELRDRIQQRRPLPLIRVLRLMSHNPLGRVSKKAGTICSELLGTRLGVTANRPGRLLLRFLHMWIPLRPLLSFTNPSFQLLSRSHLLSALLGLMGWRMDLSGIGTLRMDLQQGFTSRSRCLCGKSRAETLLRRATQLGGLGRRTAWTPCHPRLISPPLEGLGIRTMSWRGRTR